MNLFSSGETIIVYERAQRAIVLRLQRLFHHEIKFISASRRVCVCFFSSYFHLNHAIAYGRSSQIIFLATSSPVSIVVFASCFSPFFHSRAFPLARHLPSNFLLDSCTARPTVDLGRHPSREGTYVCCCR